MDDVRGLAARVLLASFDGPTLPDWARRRLEQGMGGICLYGTNVVDRAQIAALNRAVPGVQQGRPRTLRDISSSLGGV